MFFFFFLFFLFLVRLVSMRSCFRERRARYRERPGAPASTLFVIHTRLTRASFFRSSQMVGFVLAVMNTFNGDLLTMMAKVPLAVAFVLVTISAASVVQKVNPSGYFPSNVNSAAMNAFSGAKLDEVFTYKAEMVNGRMAMLAMLLFILTATVF